MEDAVKYPEDTPRYPNPVVDPSRFHLAVLIDAPLMLILVVFPYISGGGAISGRYSPFALPRKITINRLTIVFAAMLFMPGMPGGMELAIPFLLSMMAALFAYPIYLHAKRRDNDHALAWGAGAFFSAFVGNFIGVIIVGILYYVVEVKDA